MKIRWIAGVLLGLLTTLASPHPGNDPVMVRFVNPGFEDAGFWRAVTDTMVAAGEQLELSIEVSYAGREWPRMRANALAAIQATPAADFLILVNEHQQAGDLLALAEARELTTLMLLNSLTAAQETEFGRARDTLPHWLGSITPDNRRAGYEMARSVIEKARELKPERDRLRLLTLAGDFATPASINRLAGLDDALVAYPHIVEQRRLTVNWSYDEAYRRVDTWLAAGQRFDLVWAANDPIALGAMAAAESHGLEAGGDYAIAGLNWSAEALHAVRSGKMTLTHGGHFLAGAWIAVLIHDYAHGVDFGAEEPHLRFPMAAIGPGVSPALFDVLSREEWSRIDFQRFSRAHRPGITDYDFSIQAIEAAIRPIDGE